VTLKYSAVFRIAGVTIEDRSIRSHFSRTWLIGIYRGFDRLESILERGVDIDRLPWEIMENGHETRPLLDTGPWRGRSAVATRPRGGDWLEDEGTRWRRSGIVGVSLREEHEAGQLDLHGEAQAMGANGVRFISFPVPDRGVPASAPAASPLITAISDALETGDNVAVHCRQGLDRSGMIAAGVVASAGVAPERAIEIVGAARGEIVPETLGQRSWVRRQAGRLPGGLSRCAQNQLTRAFPIVLLAFAGGRYASATGARAPPKRVGDRAACAARATRCDHRNFATRSRKRV
jgi:hypothetical protein